MSLASPLFAVLAAVPLVATLLLGVQLRLQYVHEVLERPRALLVGLAGQLLLLPLLAALFLWTWPVPQGVGLGFFVLAAVPGGALSNMVAFAGRGRLSLSVVLTAGSTLAGVATIPGWVGVGLWLTGGEAVDLPVGRMVAGSFALLVVPLAIGVAIGARNRPLAARLERPTRRAMLLLFAVGAAAYLAQRGHAIAASFSLATFAGAALLHTGAVLLAWGAARRVGLGREDSFTLGIEVGLQNVVVALLVAELLGRRELVPLIGCYMLATVVLVPLWLGLLGPSAALRAREAALPGASPTA